MYALRRHAALVLFVVALLSVALFALGLTLCIDWGGANAPPGDFSWPASIILSSH